MSITPEWFLRARNGLGPAIPPAALHAIMGSDEAGYAHGFCGDGDGGGGNGVGSGGSGYGGICYGDGNGSGRGGSSYGDGNGSGGSGYGDGWGNGGGDGCGGDSYGVWSDPAVYFEEEA